MYARYRGRNKRFAFNTLLRGDTPIRAQLRSRSSHFEDQGDGEGLLGGEGEARERKSVLESDSEYDDDLRTSLKDSGLNTSEAGLWPQSPSPETELGIEESLYETFMRRQQDHQWSHSHRSTAAGAEAAGLLKARSESSDDELNASSSDCLTANIRHTGVSLDENQDIDVETGTMMSINKPNILFQQLNPIEMDIYQRRVNFMKTHGAYLVFCTSCVVFVAIRQLGVMFFSDIF